MTLRSAVLYKATMRRAEALSDGTPREGQRAVQGEEVGTGRNK